MITREHDPESSVASRGARAVVESLDERCVVFATNGSAEADAAFRLAAALATRDGMMLRVLTVLEPLPAIPPQPAGVGWYVAIERERGQRVLDDVHSELSRLADPPASLRTMLVGNPGATIADAAREWNAKYVVVGTGRRGAVDRFLRGDTVVRVMRHSVSPVIAVPSSHGALPRYGVVAVDFGTPSLAAARSAAAVIGDGVLHIVHIRPEIDLPATDAGAWSAVYESGAQSLMTKLADELQSRHPDVRTTTNLLRGDVPSVLLDYADRTEAELIAVGQHGHGVVDRFLFGSVARAIVHAAPCTVLVAPATEGA
jgi:nucleotide-binding universal stress UspA family protein